MNEHESATLEITATGIAALTKEAIHNKLTGDSPINLMAMNKPGTIIWTDPSTGEERYTEPGSMMYSTALIFASHYIDADGNRKIY